MRTTLATTGMGDTVRDLIVSNVFANIKDMLDFLPVVMALFFFLSLVRSDKCITHITFIVSGLLHGVNLSKEDVMPVLVKFKYAIPTIVTAHALADRHSEGVAVLLAPFVDYATGLPVCSFFMDTFFPGGNKFVVTNLCLLKVLIKVLTTFLCGEALFGKSPIPFIVRLPGCQLPKTEGMNRLL